MADVHSIVRAGIYNRLNGSTNTFKTSVSSRLYYHLAEQDASLPYAVFDLLPINPSWDSGDDYYECIIQVRVSADTLSECETISGYATDRLKNSLSSLSFTGFEAMYLLPEPQINLGETDQVWNMVIQFRLKIQKAR